ncbi:MAG: hypothetical protein LBP21_00470 [Synergistaceae bacterium]|nr:hypothetical protein [Synergistaceae bacterium]
MSDEFIGDLKTGKLRGFLEAVYQDQTLCLEIRDEYVSIYYRGGNLFRIKPSAAGYSVAFDSNYSEDKKKTIQQIRPGDYQKWIENIPALKSEMDNWFFRHPKPEREIQQLIVNENNHGALARDTDYFIADIEYADSENSSRFDMIALKWLSKGPTRKMRKLTPAFIEVKHGDSALAGSAGIEKHVADISSFLSDTEKKKSFYKELEIVFEQKLKLELIQGVPNLTEGIEINTETNPELIFIFANHKPTKSVLRRELEKVSYMADYAELKARCDIKIATSSMMGYGLYSENMWSLEDFIK